MDSKLIKELYNFIKKADKILSGNNDLLNLISSIWDVYQKPSTGEDKRYKYQCRDYSILRGTEFLH